MANGLVTKHTDLKSLKYGSMPFGGKAPYVTKDINNPPTSNATGMQLQKRLDDTSRIAQMLVDKPGLKFLANEALLQQTHTVDKLQKASNIGAAALSIVKGTVLNTAKIALSTLAQVPVNGTGTHFIEGFRTDTYLQPAGGNTRSAFAQFFGAGGVHGAPLALAGKTIIQDNTGASNFGKTLPSNLVSYGKDGTQEATELKYSVYSYDDYLNTTRSEKDLKAQNRLNAQAGIPISVISGSLPPTEEYPSYSPFDSPDLITEYNVNDNRPVNRTIEDFRIAYPDVYHYDYNANTVNKEQRVGLGNQGKKRTSYTNYMDIDPLMQDKVNMLDILNSTEEEKVNLGDGRDLVKFYFEIITPEDNKFLHFRAFIDSIDDGYTANWQGHKYNGRAENFYTYGGFDRDINVSFNIAAASRAEMKPLYRKMVLLASSTAPTYGGSGLMRGTLARITIGSYFAQIPGVITSVKYTVDNNIPWEIAMSNPDGGAGNNTDDDVQELPMVLKCTVSFKPIHDFAPQTGLYHYFTSNKGLNGSNSFFSNGEGSTTPAKPARQQVVDTPPPPAPKVPKALSQEQVALNNAVAAAQAAKTTAAKKTTTAAVQGAQTALKNKQKGETWKNTGGLSPQAQAILKARGK